MKRVLYANGWIGTFFGLLLTIGYYISFYDQIARYAIGQQLLIGLLMVFQIWGSVALIRILSALANRLRIWRVMLFIKIIVMGILLFMVADAATLFVLNMKFSLSEGLRLMSGGTHQDALISFGTVVGFVVTLVVFFVVIYTFFLPKRSKRIPSFLLWLLSLSLLAAVTTGSLLRTMSGPYLGSLLINPLLYNINTIIDGRLYDTSGNFDLSQYPQYFHSYDGLSKKPNIIVIFAESFEPKYSYYNSGIYNYLPKFDALQKDGVKYNYFLAPGCVSENTHTSFLQGLYPFSYGDTFSQGYQRFTGYVDTLPNFLNNQGYDTTFLSTVSLKFLDQYSFLKKMGFQTIVGDEVFRGIKDYVFLAAPDKPLYNKALSLVDTKLLSGKPFFLNMQTISTHRPRNTPYGRSEESARRYADDQIAEFYKQLKTTNFFDNGILIIFGDHRVPMKSSMQEQTILGPLWPSKVLAAIVGQGFASGLSSDMIVQPIDIHFSLKRLIASGSIDLWRDYNDIFDTRLSQREWGLHSCKYSNDSVSVATTSGLSLLDQLPTHPAYGFVRELKTYQQQNIFHK